MKSAMRLSSKTTKRKRKIWTANCSEEDSKDRSRTMKTTGTERGGGKESRAKVYHFKYLPFFHLTGFWGFGVLGFWFEIE